MRKNRTRLTASAIVAPPVAPDRLAEYRRFGYVSDQTISASVVRAARQWGSRPAVIEGGHQLTYQELLEVVERAAAWLVGAGVGPGDVVCWQTPNWWEAHAMGLAIWHAGAVSCPIAPFYREHELRQVIEQVRPAAVVTAETFRGFAHAEAFDDLLAGTGLGDTARVILRGTRPGWSPFDVVVSHGRRQEAAALAPDEPCLVLFTSGTTAGAKAAVHSSRTLLAETRQLADAWGLSWEDVAYMAAPLQHITGVLNAMTIPLLVGASAVLSERWEAGVAVADIMRHRVTYSAGATVFLQELTDAARGARVHLPLRMFACGGAAVPRAVMERSEEQGIPAARVYGMTELPTVTVMNRAYPFDLRAETDGAIAPGVQVRVVGPNGEPAPAGCAGELLVRGPEQMLGYLDAEANRGALDDAGWFSTGDVGLVDAAGFVTITGRVKDVINRGGEKFSARDIEDLLVAHPAVRHAAVVAGPDARFGEVPVAFVVLGQPGQASVEELSRHLHATGLARQKTPVAWHFVDALPMTPSGKVKKFELVATADTVERQG
ncbi:MAG: coA-dependent ligase [Mycobacterium sp.]|jgi:acyl-CoA synthetase (AMP-forming)/AMP-acid ligase II|uniref:AMP-binding protein n=1 Tax=Mycobacterium sp. TaxID=1785 RepID=UPI002633D7CC|nr:AMP-binding protein [Mycobacterium sp.]MCW2664508.1 coA-dependent ligase [Mycobacterium sp.]